MSKPQEITFEIPSKTFILGEYLAINGTASLVLATEPSFFVRMTDDVRYGFHKESPAGVLRNKLKLSQYGFSFFDPHKGRGGFGRSTAEYLAVYLYHLSVEKRISNPTDFILENLEEFVTQYQACAGKDYKPSGADLVAQVCGGLCWYDGMNYRAESLNWPFPGYDIFIFHTGKKLETHEHLKELRNINLNHLIPILLAGRTALDQENLKVFCQSINYYYDILNELGLSNKSVYKSVQKLRESDKVLAAKGCGAMGVDTVIVLGQKSDLKEIKEIAFQEDFQYISSLSLTHKGVCIRRAM